MAEIVTGEESGGPWSMTTCPCDPENELRGVIRRPLTAIASAPRANSRLTTSCTSSKLIR